MNVLAKNAIIENKVDTSIGKRSNMSAIIELKNSNDDFEVEFEVLPLIDSYENDERKRRIIEGIASVDEQLEVTQEKLDKLNIDIDRLTNQADSLDYMVAVGSGILAGMIDILFVGEFSLEKANEIGKKSVNDFVIKVAKTQGYKRDDLYGSVKYLEDKFNIAADKVTNDFGCGLQHHLRDFSHHPTPVGLFFSILTQFTPNHKVYGVDVSGVFHTAELNEKGLELIGKNFPEKITFGVINWFFHMVSDMAGSSSSIANGKLGTGLPGPIVSLLKEVSALPIFKSTNEKGNKEFSVWVSKLFDGTLLGDRDENGKLVPLKFDLRTEIGVFEQLGKQALPVIINECIVRVFYFIRRLCKEIKKSNICSFRDIGKIEWKNTLPFKNRTLIRMLTISTGTLTAIDLADAAIESAVKSGGISTTFLSNMLLRVNFIGIGRFAVAIGSDVGKGIKRNHRKNEVIELLNQHMFLLNSKLFYKQAGMWIAAEDAGKTIDEAYSMIEEISNSLVSLYSEMKSDLNSIGKYISGIEKKNPMLLEDINDILKWG